MHLFASFFTRSAHLCSMKFIYHWRLVNGEAFEVQ